MILNLETSQQENATISNLDPSANELMDNSGRRRNKEKERER